MQHSSYGQWDVIRSLLRAFGKTFSDKRHRCCWCYPPFFLLWMQIFNLKYGSHPVTWWKSHDTQGTELFCLWNNAKHLQISYGRKINPCLLASHCYLGFLLFVAKSFPSLNHSLLVTFLNLSFVNQAIKSFSTFNSLFNPLKVRDYQKPKAIFYFYLMVAFENLSLC